MSFPPGSFVINVPPKADLSEFYAQLCAAFIEIPSALDDWDREFELRTGSLPPFSRLTASASG